MRFHSVGPISFLHPGITLPDSGHGEDFRWWTAAITIAELPAGGMPTASKARAKSTGRGAATKGKWVPKGLATVLPAVTDREKDDQDDSFGEIKTSAYQIWDEAEELPAQATKSLERRWRMAVNIFHRRCFTNDRVKVAEWCNLLLSFQPFAFSNSRASSHAPLQVVSQTVLALRGSSWVLACQSLGAHIVLGTLWAVMLGRRLSY